MPVPVPRHGAGGEQGEERRGEDGARGREPRARGAREPERAVGGEKPEPHGRGVEGALRHRRRGGDGDEVRDGQQVRGEPERAHRRREARAAREGDGDGRDRRPRDRERRDRRRAFRGRGAW